MCLMLEFSVAKPARYDMMCQNVETEHGRCHSCRLAIAVLVLRSYLYLSGCHAPPNTARYDSI